MALIKDVYTRREFMRTMAIAGAGLTIPSFLTQTAAGAQAGAIPGFKDDRILVVIQLGGGNDGLNAVVPYGDDNYYQGRPRLAVPKNELLRIDDHLALNDVMAPIKDLYDSGELAIINGVGYPNPNRSHFRSMEIWHTATDSNRYSSTGWVGRYFDNACSGSPTPAVGVNVGGEAPQAFMGRKGLGISFNQPNDFRWAEGGGGNNRMAFDQINKVGTRHSESGSTLDFLRHTTANAVIASDSVIKSSKVKRTPVEYPNARLSQSLRNIATLIAGGLPTRIYYASMSGFDTHANQSGVQENLLGQFSGALRAFLADLKSIGAHDRVTVMCFSEFGRRVAENASRGTDHGTAGPMFLAGAGINPGLHGKYPSLTDLDEGDLKHTVDFRAVYGEVIGKWLGAETKPILGKDFKAIGAMA